ncbi:hypothetical protein REPUB_Repub04eG0144300 [Reevesia pubescens]
MRTRTVRTVRFRFQNRRFRFGSTVLNEPWSGLAIGQDGGVFELSFTGQNNQVNVSIGVVETQINNALTQQKPLAVYQVDKVLLPAEFFEAKSPAAPSPTTKKSSPGSNPNSIASTADEPASADHSSSNGRNMGLGLVVGLVLACMGALS